MYRNHKVTLYGDNLLDRFKERGFLMTVRANGRFKDIISKFDPAKSIVLYSLWDGYRTRSGSTIPDFLSSCKWEHLHTSGHASLDNIRMVIEKTKPSYTIPIHTENPEVLQRSCPTSNVLLLKDREELIV